MSIGDYSAWLTLSGARPATIDARRQCLYAFTASLPKGRALADATHRDVTAFLARPLSAASRRTYRSHLRAYYTWAVEEGLCTTNPTDKVPVPRVPRGTPRPVTDDELRRALAAADGRMRAWLLLMALAGLRCLEVAALQPRDLILEPTPMLFLRETKGGRTATVPAHQDVLAALSVLPIDSDGVWWHATPGHVSRTVSEFLRAQGIQASAHQLRHFAGTSWYRASGHDLLTTARLLRHANVATSQIYAQLDPVRPAAVVDLVQVPGQRSPLVAV